MAGGRINDLYVRDFPVIRSDEPPRNEGTNTGPTPFDLQDLEASAEGVLDIRGRRGEADVPVHFTSVRLHVKIKTSEPDERVQRLIQLAKKYCPVQSLIRAAVPDFDVTWESL